jgi:hypothetical protein
VGYENPWLVSACSIDDIQATKIGDGEQIAFLNRIVPAYLEPNGNTWAATFKD